MTLHDLVLRPSSGIGRKCLLTGWETMSNGVLYSRQSLEFSHRLLIDILTYFANCGLRKHTL